jgi:5'-nucleotidase
MTDKEPLILVTNDDGIESEGLEALRYVAEGFGEVWVVAPSFEQSGVGHGITLHKPLKVEKRGERTFCLNGSPTDCVWLAIRNLLPRMPSLVLSGINKGSNLGEDVTYSGTVAAAMEGALRGIPSIAFSLVGRDVFDFSVVKPWVRKILEGLGTLKDLDELLLSVNLPPFGDGLVRGIQITRVARGMCRVDGHVIETKDPDGQKVYSFAKKDSTCNYEPGTDAFAVLNGFVSMTPLSLDWTKFEMFKVLKEAYGAYAEESQERVASKGIPE